MSEAGESNDSIPEEQLTNGQEEQSSGTMLFTMLLLTVGFLFASVLLVNESLRARSAEGNPILVMSALIEKGQSMKPSPKAADTNAAQKAQSSPFSDIRNLVMNQSSGDKIKWPRLKMTGFGTSTDGAEEFAIINGDLVHPGEFAGKVELIEVRAHDVVVEYMGERKTLTVGLED